MLGRISRRNRGSTSPHVVEEEQAAFHFVHHGWPLRANQVDLPQQCQAAEELLGLFQPFARQQFFCVKLVQVGTYLPQNTPCGTDASLRWGAR